MYYGNKRSCCIWQTKVNARIIDVVVYARDPLTKGPHTRGKLTNELTCYIDVQVASNLFIASRTADNAIIITKNDVREFLHTNLP